MSVSAQQLIHIANKTPDRSRSGGAVATTILFDGELRRTHGLLLEEETLTHCPATLQRLQHAPPSSYGGRHHHRHHQHLRDCTNCHSQEELLHAYAPTPGRIGKGGGASPTLTLRPSNLR
jgi:hypothetical protein